MNRTASWAIPSIVSGVEPPDPPTPRFPKVITRRRVASPSTMLGSQLSRFPARWIRRTSGTPSSGPSSR